MHIFLDLLFFLSLFPSPSLSPSLPSLSLLPSIPPSLCQGDHIHGGVVLEQMQLEAAISGVIYEEIERAKTVADAATQGLIHHLQHVPPSFSK